MPPQSHLGRRALSQRRPTTSGRFRRVTGRVGPSIPFSAYAKSSVEVAGAGRTRSWPATWTVLRPRWRSWESTRALGTCLRERGADARAGAEQVIDDAVGELANAAVDMRRACTLVGRPRSTHYWRARPRPGARPR